MRHSLFVLSVLVLGACSPEKPWMMEDTNMNTGPMRIIESRHVVKKPLAEFSDTDIADTARLYNRQGAGPVYIAVAYDDTIGKGIDRDTAARAQVLAEGLARAGVTQKIIVSTVQLEAPIPVAVIAFDTLEATGPAGCDELPSYERAAIANGSDGHDYRIGCGVKTIMARQVAYPSDLEGRAGLDGEADAERLTNIINNDYRKGETHDFLPSYIISELAQQGG